MSDSAKAVFLSYASQDLEAAKRICDALRAAGVEVWFDQSELVGGDAWDQKIRKQIRECALFVPLISANTNARPEGYFRREWKLAADRMDDLADDHPFLLPVVIDDTLDATARVPERFRQRQWVRLPGGAAPETFGPRVKNLLDGKPLETAAAPRVIATREGPSDRAPGGRRWLRPVLAAAGVVVIALAVTLVLRRGREAPVAVGVPAAAAAAPLSEARTLVERARAIMDQGSLDRGKIETANGLCEQALKLDPADPLAWAQAARADLASIYPYGYDHSIERRHRAQERAARATSIAPDLFPVQVIQAAVLAHAVGTPAMLAEAEKTFRALSAAHPDDPELVRQLAEVLREQKRFTEAAKLFESTGDFEVAGWSYFLGDALPEALSAVKRSPRRIGALQLKAMLYLCAYNDLDAAQAAIDEMKPSELTSELAGSIAMLIAMYRREPDRLLELAAIPSEDYIESNAFTGPRRYYSGIAYEIAGRASQAEVEWRAALAAVEARLKATPDSRTLVLWSAWLHLKLNDRAEAERLFARSQALGGLAGDTLDGINARMLAVLGRREALLSGIEQRMGERVSGRSMAYAELRFDPAYDALRDDPRFQKILRDYLPPGAKPLDEPKAAARAAEADAKSVAVLAFDNLSEDKSNEYFSDGISEELLNVLAKIPGLKVSGRTSAFFFKGRNVSVAEIGRQLGVAYVVEGSVRRAGSRVRIAAQLVKAADGFQVWSDDFDRELKDVFAVQDEIAGLIARNLRLKLGEGSHAVAAVDPEAHRLYLQGRQALLRRTAEGFTEAGKLFHEAANLAPNWAPIYAGLADTLILSVFGNSTQRVVSNDLVPHLVEARALAEHARELDPDSAEAFVALSRVAMITNHLEEAEKFALRAAALNPSEADAYLTLGRVYSAQGRMEEAIAAFARGVDLNPLAPRILDNLAAQYQLAGRYEEGWRMIERAHALQPDGIQIQCYRARMLTGLHRRDEAMAVARWLIDNPKPEERDFRLLEAAGVYVGFGEQAEAEKIAGRIERTAAEYPIVQAYLGRPAEAIPYLDQIDFGWVDDVLWGRGFDPIRHDPRFEAFLARAHLTEAHARVLAWRAAHDPIPAAAGEKAK